MLGNSQKLYRLRQVYDIMSRLQPFVFCNFELCFRIADHMDTLKQFPQ